MTESDILFDCPKCGKSMCIDEQGAGRVVSCPDCGAQMRVPIPERMRAGAGAGQGPAPGEDYTAARESEAGEATVLRERVDRLEVTMEEVQARKRLLEKLRIDHSLRFERIRSELVLIQAAIDRINDQLQDVSGPAR